MMNDLHFHLGRYDSAIELVMRHHYSRRAPANVQCVGTLHESGGLFGDYGCAVAACIFSIPPTRWNYEVWELSRLVSDKPGRQLSRLIALTCKGAQKKGADLLVSFADKTHQHHGGVYQASSWRYNGARDARIDGVLINGEFIPGRTCNSIYGTQSASKLSNILRKEVLPHYDNGKHLYWRALTKKGAWKARMLGLKSLPYPKPGMPQLSNDE